MRKKHASIKRRSATVRSTQDEVPSEFGFTDWNDGWLQRMRDAQAASSLGTVGPYELKKEVGRGGQGVVYLAYQRGTNRQIALKRLLAGRFASATARRRFEREVETLASLKHPGIVTAFSVDVVDEIPFLAMEWIDGVPITAWAACRRKGLPEIRAIVHLFLKVCNAIGHAHMHGVIHRDIKPSNILVDAVSEPHVLDFGLAKVVRERAGYNSSTTNTQRFIGTLAYASPEHLRRTSDDVDVRSDVYSLGVVFYEMLTGRLPYDVEGGIATTAQAIEHVDPARPSVWNRTIDRDLESITLKLLAKDRGSRYQSIDALCADLHRYLSGDPVSASMTGSVTLLCKAVRRHRLACGFAAAGFLIVATFGVYMSSMYGRARHAERVAEQRLGAMATLSDRAESEAGVAQAEARKVQAMAAFMREVVATQDPMKSGGGPASRQVLDQMSQLVSEELAGFPVVAAGIQTDLGRTYASLGLYETAEEHLRAALGAREEIFGGEHIKVADSLFHLAEMIDAKLGGSSAHPLYDRCLNIVRSSSRRDDHLLASILWRTASAQPDVETALALCREALAISRRQQPRDEPRFACALFHVGVALGELGESVAGNRLLRQARSLVRASRQISNETAGVLLSEAWSLREEGDLAGAEQLCREYLTLVRNQHGTRHPLLVEGLPLLVLVCLEQGNLEQADEVAREFLAIEEDSLLGVTQDFIRAVALWGGVQWARADYKAAEKLLRSAVVMQRELSGDESLPMGGRLNSLAVVLRDQGRYDEAQPMFLEALSLTRRFDGDKHRYYANVLNNLARLLYLKGDYSEGERYIRKALRIRCAALPASHPEVVESTKILQMILAQTRNVREPEAVPRERPIRAENR